jgi:hypothetical protein
VVSDPTPRIVLVRGVVYKLLDMSPFPISRPRPKYYRQSVPPDATPGKRSKWPAAYLPHRLPEHEVIDEESARETIDASMARWRKTFEETIR